MIPTYKLAASVPNINEGGELIFTVTTSGVAVNTVLNYTLSGQGITIFDVVGSLQQLTILKTTGQTFIGAKTTASGRLVVNSATADAHLQIVGANAPSIRIDNAGSGGTQSPRTVLPLWLLTVCLLDNEAVQSDPPASC